MMAAHAALAGCRPLLSTGRGSSDPSSTSRAVSSGSVVCSLPSSSGRACAPPSRNRSRASTVPRVGTSTCFGQAHSGPATKVDRPCGSLQAHGQPWRITDSWAEEADEWGDYPVSHFLSALPEENLRPRPTFPPVSGGVNTGSSPAPLGKPHAVPASGRSLCPRPEERMNGISPMYIGNDRGNLSRQEASTTGSQEPPVYEKPPYSPPCSGSARPPPGQPPVQPESSQPRVDQRHRTGSDAHSSRLPPTSNGIEVWNGIAPQVGSSHGDLYGRLQEVFVILFGVGQGGNEGLYSLRAINCDDGPPQDTIIAFEDKMDAQRYASQLDGSFGAFTHVPQVCSILPEELLNFCVEAGYDWRLELAGSALLPPDINVGTTDWERSLRLRTGHFSVLDDEPEIMSPNFSMDCSTDFELSEMDILRLQLERLFEQSE